MCVIQKTPYAIELKLGHFFGHPAGQFSSCGFLSYFSAYFQRHVKRFKNASTNIVNDVKIGPNIPMDTLSVSRMTPMYTFTTPSEFSPHG